MVDGSKRELRARANSFRHAFAGVGYVLRTQKNSWIHALASLVVVLLGLWLNLSQTDWAIIVLTIAIVWTIEFMNTALEVVVDLAMPEKHQLAKVAKDVSAAAVLISACAAVLVGILIMGPPLWQRMAG
jgi:diacylglycerol kinase (ATP)